MNWGGLGFMAIHESRTSYKFLNNEPVHARGEGTLLSPPSLLLAWQDCAHTYQLTGKGTPAAISKDGGRRGADD